MVVDFHTHIFPDKIAAKTIALLSEKANIPAYSDGTLSGLQQELVRADVQVGVALPVLTRPESFDGILRFAQGVNEGFFKGEHRVYSFAGMHPDCEDVEEKIALLRASGFKGIKLHPDYQQTYIDDERYVRILNAAIDEDLIVVTHSGVDVGYPEPVHCTPERAVKALERLKGDVKIVFAHYGACDMYGAVYELLAGKNVYFDTSYVLDEIGKPTFEKILVKHGDDRVLFATDSPWKSVASMREAFRQMGLPDATERKILSENALRLLGEDFRKP